MSVAESQASGQAEIQKSRAVQIEEALLWREVQRIREQIAPHIVAIVNAFPKFRIERKSAESIGREIGNSIRYGITSSGRFDEESVFGAGHLKNAIDTSEARSLVAYLVEAFLKRVDEVGEIAEEAAMRAEQAAQNG